METLSLIMTEAELYLLYFNKLIYFFVNSSERLNLFIYLFLISWTIKFPTFFEACQQQVSILYAVWVKTFFLKKCLLSFDVVETNYKVSLTELAGNPSQNQLMKK